MECFLGRQLLIEETVHHKDGNFDNNEISNLEIVVREAHSRKHAKKCVKVPVVCAWCGKGFLRNPAALDHSAKQKRAGPFCGKKCVGQYGARIKKGGKVKRKQARYPVKMRKYE
jgi:hypothetical protein